MRSQIKTSTLIKINSHYDPSDFAYDHCPKTHGTGFGGGVDLAVGQVAGAQPLGGQADGADFCVPGGVLGLEDLVVAPGQKPASAHDAGPKRASLPPGAPSAGFLNRDLHETAGGPGHLTDLYRINFL